MRHQNVRLLIVGAAAAVVLGVISTLGLAAAAGAFSRPSSLAISGWKTPCDVPALAGTVVNVTLANRGGMMGGPYQPGPGPDGQWGPHTGMGVMRILVTPGIVPRGTVSIRALNIGAWAHEVVVLPLPPGQGVGQRPIGVDGKIDETGSLGETSRTCGAGSGDGIVAGATGWTTLTLEPGRYELVCNIPGHYASGMYNELDVTP
jgi:hypothetical protein